METLKQQQTWLLTGCGGFIGSHLLEYLLAHNQIVIGVDNFATGHRKNIDSVTKGKENFHFLELDISSSDFLEHFEDIHFDFILHQAALGSVPRSIKDPLNSHRSNVDGFINILELARFKKVKKLVYASSSSVYGDHPDLPKLEDKVGNVLSPYAATKKINEVYADVYSRVYQLPSVGLRYFNVFGQRQDPNGQYAAVIPKWVASLIKGETLYINGDGETSRDFCFVQNAVQANIKAALSSVTGHEVLNIACHAQTSLNQLKDFLVEFLKERGVLKQAAQIEYRDFRPGDVRHSLANIEKAGQLIGYKPTHNVKQGLEVAIDWYIKNLG